ncbi:MAG: SMI1/KNR4 family protein [Tahibacter sp.]
MKLTHVLALLPIVGVPAFGSATTVQVTANVGDVAPFQFEISVAGKPVCALTRPDAKTPPAACRFDFPADAQRITANGSYAWTDSESRKLRSLKGSQAFDVLDFAAAGKHLSTPDASYGERIKAFIGATRAFAHTHKVEYSDASLETAKPVTQSAIDAAQKRLGFALPIDFVSLLRTTGPLVIDDHSVMGVDDINDAYTQMLKVWGTPEAAMQDDYNENFRAVLKTSTLLFTEVGDGYGGLLYRPGKTKTCGDAPSYYWTSQEGGTTLLKQADGHCVDFSGAFRWVLNRFVVDSLANEINESSEQPVILIDSSTGVQTLQLTVDTGDTFHVALNLPWSE